ELRFQFIEDHRSDFRLEKMCSVLKVSRSGFYAWRAAEASETDKRREKLTERIKWHFFDSDETYGSPRIRKELVN
ncbi:IS3 family transposase, partial [Paenibacillus marinisediminis]